jgi:hypothetical protein
VNPSLSVSWTKGSAVAAGLIASTIIPCAAAPTVAQDSIGSHSQTNTRVKPTGLSSQSSAAPIEGLIRIGRTGIHCLRTPCPWRGIMKIREDGLADGKPVWAGDELPILEASPADRERIRSSWQDSGCLLVEGRLEQRRFAVRHITGGC